MTALDDLGLRIPLHGVQLIEASAGTGKTFTLATLYARLVIEQGLPVSTILAVTFTEAATRELRERLRARLLLAQRLVEARVAADADADADSGDSDDQETRLTRRLVEAAMLCEGEDALCRRLRAAAEQMDLAPIHTIHGFCRRALADHALEAGQPVLDRELLQNEAALRREVALEFWRLHSREDDSARTLAAIWSSPEALAGSLRDLLALEVLLPEPKPVDGRVLAALQAARDALAEAFLRDGDAARELLRQAATNKDVNATYVKDAAVDPVWQALAAWSAGSRAGDPATDKLGNYASSFLRDKTNKNKSTPVSPLFDAIDAWRQCWGEQQSAEQQRRIALIHEARAFALARMDALKRERGLLGFDDMIRGVADALEGASGDSFASRLQEQYSIALVDEFQDTDARQWAIFRRLFAHPAPAAETPAAPRALFLIGDPKQAIYRFRGGDVFAYLSAAETASDKHRLQCNFRSRPLALRAVQGLFELSGEAAFAQPGISFEPVTAGTRCRDEHFLLDGVPAAALNVLLLAEDSDGENVEAARARATDACVASIHALLAAGLAGTARLVDRDGITRAVEPRDIAVLVEANRDAERVQRALSMAGIPSVAAGRSSLYQTEEAEHLCWLLAALVAPGDDQRLRAALAAPLFGLDAAALAGFELHEAQHRLWQDALQHWQQRVQRFGPMAMLGEICAAQAPRLLALPDGERRLSNYLQLAEELQCANAHALGPAGLLGELEQRIEDADSANDAELLRLESDADRVRILTLHMSKGLEFELVYLPFVATGGAERKAGIPPMARFHDGSRRVAVLYPEKAGEHGQHEAAEERAERLRLLYVGLTRARLATWFAWGAVNNVEKTPMAWLLHREPGQDKAADVDATSIAQRLAVLLAHAGDAVSVQAAGSSAGLLRLVFPGSTPPGPAAIARRVLDRDWWVYSFSQLAREDGGIDIQAAEDETESSPALVYSRFSGTRFGNSLHAALEHANMPRWLDHAGPLPPTGEFEVVAEALREHGYGSDADLEEGMPLLTALISETLNARLPEGARLAALAEADRRNEMEFHLALAPTRVSDLVAVLHRHGIVGQRQGFGLRQRIEGLLTGRIDLVYRFDDRYFVLDYKSNQLRGYGHEEIALTVRDSEYDLQYVLYTLALHRWLRFKLGADYDIDWHLGGVRYLFCRGLDRGSDEAPGVHALDLPRALIDELDHLFEGQAA